MSTLDPMMIDALQVLGGAVAGYATSWWMNNRKKVVESLSEEIQDAIDHLEDATGLDVPDSLEDKIDEVVEAVVNRVEDVVEDVADTVSEAVEEGESVTKAVSEVVSEAVEEAKADLDVAIEDLEDLTVAGLRERLKELGVDITGRPRKAELIQMIVNHVNGGELE